MGAKKKEVKKDCIWCFKNTKKDMEVIKSLKEKYSINVSNFIRVCLKNKLDKLQEEE